MVDSLESTASKDLVPRRRGALTVTEAVDTTTVLIAATSVAAAAGAVVWWRRRHPR